MTGRKVGSMIGVPSGLSHDDGRRQRNHHRQSAASTFFRSRFPVAWGRRDGAGALLSSLTRRPACFRGGNGPRPIGFGGNGGADRGRTLVGHEKLHRPSQAFRSDRHAYSVSSRSRCPCEKPASTFSRTAPDTGCSGSSGTGFAQVQTDFCVWANPAISHRISELRFFKRGDP